MAETASPAAPAAQEGGSSGGFEFISQEETSASVTSLKNNPVRLERSEHLESKVNHLCHSMNAMRDMMTRFVSGGSRQRALLTDVEAEEDPDLQGVMRPRAGYRPPELEGPNVLRQVMDEVNKMHGEQSEKMERMRMEHNRVKEIGGIIGGVACVCTLVFNIILLVMVLNLGHGLGDDTRDVANQNNQLQNLKQNFATRDEVQQLVATLDDLKQGMYRDLHSTKDDIMSQISSIRVTQQKHDDQEMAGELGSTQYMRKDDAKQEIKEIDKKAEPALLETKLASSILHGVCFVKSRYHECPPRTAQVDLTHSYSPDKWDPWCGGSGPNPGDTADEADGNCNTDASGNIKSVMYGCCLNL